VAMAEARNLIRGVAFKDSADAVVEGADAVVLVTEWPEFAELDLAEVARLMRGKLLIDGRNVFDPGRASEAGLVYEGVGRSAGRSPSYAAGA
jgi:UDPglucose 6-dehydrogenase